MTDVDNFLAHYGVKGMRWGVKKGLPTPLAPRTKKEQKVRAARKDARTRRQTLADKDLDQLVQRLQKEKKLKELLDEDLSPGRTVTKKVLASAGGVVLGAAVAGGMKFALRSALSKKFDPDFKLDLKDAIDFMAPKPKKK